MFVDTVHATSPKPFPRPCTQRERNFQHRKWRKTNQQHSCAWILLRFSPFPVSNPEAPPCMSSLRPFGTLSTSSRRTKPFGSFVARSCNFRATPFLPFFAQSQFRESIAAWPRCHALPLSSAGNCRLMGANWGVLRPNEHYG